MTVERIDASVAGQWRLGDRVVNRMGFGSMRLTVRNDRDQAIRVLRRAVELGVDHIDTAAFYFSPGGILDGEAGEVRYAAELIREALRPYPRGLFIATKVGPDPLPDGGWGEAVTPARLRRQHSDLLRRCGEDGIAFVPFFTIAGSAREDGRKPAAAREAGAEDESGAEGGSGAEWRIAAARGDGVTGYQVRLAWTLQQGEHVLAIPGTGDVAHLEENVAAGALRLTPDEMAEMDQRW